MDIMLQAWLGDARDIAIIVYVVFGVAAFLALLVFTVFVGGLLTSTAFKVRRIVRDNVQPAMQNVQATTSTVRTTVTFVSEYAIKPVAKAYGGYRGARQFISVLARFRGKGE